MIGKTLSQIRAVIRLEMRKTFFAKRGLWVYFLALAPAVIYVGHALYAPHERHRLEALAASHPVDAQVLRSISKGLSVEEVEERLGKPYWHRSGQRGPHHKRWKHTLYKYTDGRSDVTLQFADDKLQGIFRKNLNTIQKSEFIFAAEFQFFFLRLAVFFGCVGIFINLFRGEMVDKSLHFYLLTPMRRETLLVGKYLAGLIATTTIFTTSTAIQWWAMVYPFPSSIIADFLATSGWEQFAAYCGITILACIGYGSVFLAIGLLFRNPIVPTVVVLLWESVNAFLPPALKKTGIIYYLQSLNPVDVAARKNLPPMIHLLISPTEPASLGAAICCILLIALIVLVVAGCLARRLEINYSTD